MAKQLRIDVVFGRHGGESSGANGACGFKEFFEPYIAPIDPEFFLRQKYSADSPLDPKGIRADKGLLSDMSDQEFHAKYPTIYHLRYQLMHEKRQFDVREIYLAMHHIIKYRGHFLIEDGADNFDAKQIDFFDQFQRMAAVTAGLPELETLVVPDETQSDAFKRVLFDESQTKSDRQKVLASQLLDIQDNQSKAIKDFIAALTKAVVGMKANLATLTSTAIESTDKNDWTKPLGQLDDFLLKHEEDLDEDGYALIDAANQMYSAAVLAALVPEGMGFSEAMMARYAQHKKQLALYKQVIASLPDKTQRHELKDAYADYIEHAAQNPRDAFYKRVTKVLEGVDSADARTVMTAISHDEFLLKQRTLSNGKIPYQMQQHEFDAIIENQKAYYPWLATPNPVEADAKRLPYYLDELIGFRVPYYVGPMVTEKQSQFAWMIRKADGELTPWNFFDVVDREKTANRFIQRMQTTDKYILGEDVLPKHSILYQQFEVLNELNNIRVEKHPLTTEQKQFIYQRLFVDQQRKTITKKNLQDTLVAMGEFDKAPDIGGLAKEDVMMSSLATFADYSKILPEAISDPTRQNDIEDIIAWSTIFEDTQIFFDKLKTVDWLTTQQRKRLASIRYTGWGKLSKRLLQQIPTSKHTNVMAALWATSDNFMQILQDEQFQEGLYDANRLPEETLTPDEQVEKILDEAYLSPADKKGARKVIKVMNDIVRANHGVLPEQVFLESADDPQKISGVVSAAASNWKKSTDKPHRASSMKRLRKN
nr:type II CRISPR RNA-guided endonuclease Cas9 [Lacticaseibacillus saniviri]